MNKNELKPCPFCGGPATVTNPTMWQAWCTKCHSIGEPRLTKEEAIDAWNKRSEDDVSRRDVIDRLNDWADHCMTTAEQWHLRQVIGDIKSM